MSDLVERLRSSAAVVSWDDADAIMAEAASRIEELERELVVRTTAIANLHSLIDEMRQENAALRRQLESLRPDAEKYRFIRRFDAWGIFDHKRGAELDAAIDAARKERP